MAVAPGPVNGLSVASLVLGVLWILGIGSILAVIFGFVARRQITRSARRQSGDGLAIAGIVLGFIGVFGLVAWIALLAVAAHTIDQLCTNENGDANHVTCTQTTTIPRITTISAVTSGNSATSGNPVTPGPGGSATASNSGSGRATSGGSGPVVAGGTLMR